MSDYDSDNTDILLLIPPDFFSTENHYGENVTKSYDGSTSTYLNTMYNFPRNRSSKMSDWNTDNNYAIHNTFTPLKHTKDESFNSISHKSDFNVTDKNCISEIDKFLQSNTDVSHNFNDLSVREFQPSLKVDNTLGTTNLFPSPAKPNLIKLAELWSNNGNDENSNNLQEEKLRRQHLEKNVQGLQGKLLEYQQKVAIALQVDEDKNQIIEQFAIEKARFISTLQKYDEQIKILQNQLEVETTRTRADTKLRDTINELREKNQYLEQKLKSCTISSSEINGIHKTQIKDLETRLSNSKENEKRLNDTVVDSTKILNEVQAKLEKEKLVKEISLVDLVKANDEKKSVHTKLLHEKALKSKLEKQIENLKDLSEKLNEKENQLLKELESQKFTLKNHYQNQLEKAIAKKVQQFQMQLDELEQQLLSDAKKREHLVAERAIKQIELINQKHEQEVGLINEKQNEEISLYRIQLSNASKSIEHLQEKVNAYQKQRTDIADRLHKIMEFQWQRTCEILTSPLDEQPNGDEETVNKNSFNGVIRWKNSTGFVENENFQTPKTSRDSKHNNNNEEISKKEEMIEAYIELLLQKSPKDLEDLYEMLNSHRKISNTKNQSKPPWK